MLGSSCHILKISSYTLYSCVILIAAALLAAAAIDSLFSKQALFPFSSQEESSTIVPAIFSKASSVPDAASGKQTTGYWFWAGRSVYTLPIRHGDYYIHQGTLERVHLNVKRPRFVSQGAAPVKTEADGIYLVFRVEALEQEQFIIRFAEIALRRWEQAGNVVRGIQIDYDSPTGRLSEYTAYLSRVRRLLPARYRLSVTGLADWAVAAPEKSFRDIAASCNEIVFQLYSGRSAIPELSKYLSGLKRIAIPFKVGILETMEHSVIESQELLKNPYYRGSIFFILPAV